MATHGQRIANYILDLVIMMIMAVVLFIGLMVVTMILGYDGLARWIEGMNKIQEYLLGAVITIVYYGMSETLTSRTIGKFISGTVIVMEDGSRPDSNTILKRTFCRLIPFEWLSFLGTPSRGWHDSIPDVYVVDKKMFDASMRQHRENSKAQTVELHTES